MSMSQRQRKLVAAIRFVAAPRSLVRAASRVLVVASEGNSASHHEATLCEKTTRRHDREEAAVVASVGSAALSQERASVLPCQGRSSSCYLITT